MTRRERDESERERRDHEPEEGEGNRIDGDRASKDGDETPGDGERCESEVPAHRPLPCFAGDHMLSGASTPTRSRQRATTDFVAAQSASRNSCSGEPSTL